MRYPNTLLELFLLLDNESKYSTYLVGGCVRDMLLLKNPKDYDIVTSVSMDKIEKIFSDNDWKICDSGKQFLVLNVSKSGHIYEIANFRKEVGFTDGRRPDSCEIGDMESDSHRRDFTINSIYYCPLRNEIFDLMGGFKDLNNKILKFIGKPHERIREDYLRVFRFYRFMLKGFTADKKSLKACRELFHEAYSMTTPERVRVELEKMTRGQK